VKKRLVSSLCILAPVLLVQLVPVGAENILLISVDTLRADRLSCYGYENNSTPNIDRWAREGVLFKNAYTECPLTLPAHATLLTGTHPFFHGVRDNVGYILGQVQESLAEELKKQGYQTSAVIGAYILSSEFGIAQGFESYNEDFPAVPESPDAIFSLQRPADEVARVFLEWLGDHGKEKFFAFVHFYDPHTPRPKGYDWEVSRVDETIGEIDSFLRKQGLLDQTHVILVGDHGEGLGDHGESEHGFFVYDSTLRVPLLVRPAASFAPTVKEVIQPVSLIDVMPTVLRLARLRVPAHVQGQSLVGLMLDKELPRQQGLYAETYVPYLQFGWSPQSSIRLGRYKFINSPRPELYDVIDDPLEAQNLSGGNQATTNEYRELLEGLINRYQSADSTEALVELDMETRAKLATLGYVSLVPPQSGMPSIVGVDPKDRIQAFEKYHELLGRVGSRQADESILREIESLRESAPEMRGLTFLEAGVLEHLGRYREAIEKYETVLSESPDNRLARGNLASILLQSGDLERAEKELKLVLSQSPNDARARNNLAGVYKARGDRQAAILELEGLLESKPRYASGWLNLGQLYTEAEEWQNAEFALRRSVELDPQSAVAHFNLAFVLNALGKMDEAAQHLETAAELEGGTP
jgi:arylsulfatase A-like enzyme/Flp pilus assembly protein TadD